MAAFYFKLQGRYSPANTNTIPSSIGTIEHTAAQVGTHHDDGTQNIGLSEESITWNTDVANAYWLYIRNLDATNFVQIGFATGVYTIRLRPGDFMLIPLEPTINSVFALADTATCDIQYIVYEQ